MTTTNARRIPLSVAILIAAAGAAAALILFGGRDASARDAMTHHVHVVGVSSKELALRSDMRKLWEDHVTWTRLAIISLTTDSPDAKATVARLLRNQTDIGNAVKPFYGAAAGKQLTKLLREHILVAADVIAAARKGEADELTKQQTRWRANADQISALLNSANPRFWKLGPMKAMMYEHLGLTTNEVVARLQRNWAADVRAYDNTHLQALHMADMLSDGLVKQFPARFR
jgi:hypothetical protein